MLRTISTHSHTNPDTSVPGWHSQGFLIGMKTRQGIGEKSNGVLMLIGDLEDLVSKFINQFFPPSKTTNLRNDITNFQQRFDESFCEAWERFKDLLRACPHHGFTELHQIDTFYNSLTSADQDSLNAAVGFALKNTTPLQLPLRELKSVCVTCGGQHPYYQCLATDGKASGYQDNIQAYVSAVVVNYNQGNAGYRALAWLDLDAMWSLYVLCDFANFKTYLLVAPFGGVTDGNQSQGYREPVVAPETSTIAPVISSAAPMVETTLVASPTGLCGLVPYTGSDSDSPDEMTSPEHISPLPAISPFICTDSSEAPDSSDGPPSQDPYVATVARWRSRVTARPSSSHEFPIAPVTAPPGIRRRPGLLIPPGRLFLLISIEACNTSFSRFITHLLPVHLRILSPVHSLDGWSDQAHSGSSTRDVSPRLCYPPRRAPRRRRLEIHFIGGTSIVVDAEVGLRDWVDMALGIGDRMRLEIHASTYDRALVEEEIVEPAGEDSPESPDTRDGIVRSVEDTPVDLSDAVRDFYHHMSEVRVDRLEIPKEEFRQIRRDRDDTRGRLRRTMTNTHSGITHAVIEEMIDQRMNAALEAHQVNQNLEHDNGNGNGNDNGNGNGNENGNGNGNGNGNNRGGNGDRNENHNVNGIGDRLVA
ncbi:reverse transcriptase domain-containing protein, partial [Tanacetum coccineum]